jgi:hypothetical protein
MSKYHFALVVGIDVYPGLRGNLNAARSDAQKFYNWLNPPGSQPNLNYRLILGTTAPNQPRQVARPTINEVREELLELMNLGDGFVNREEYDEWEQTRLYLYLAGHGVADGLFDRALLMANAGPPDSWSERVSTELVLKHLIRKRRAFREVVVFADCCSHPVEEADTSLVLGSKGPERNVRHFAGYATVFGNAAFEEANNDAHRGFFTQALLDGLRGEAAPMNQPIMTSNLRSYLERRVPILTAHVKGGPQQPEFFPSAIPPPAEQITFVAASSGQYIHPLQIRFKNFSGNVELLGTNSLRVPGTPVFLAAPGAVWLLGLTQGIYTVVPLDRTVPSPFRDDGRIDFSGPPATGGTHVEDL